MPKGLTYKDAGVDIAAGDALVDRIRGAAARTSRPGVLAGVGGFASLFQLNAAGQYQDPVLVSGTDGVGTKLKVAFLTGQHDSIGIDLVAMCVNDIVTTGADPLFFLDYLGTGKLEPEVHASVVEGIAKGCEIAGCALVGGETAELPGFYQAGEYDLAGFAVGVVERGELIDGQGAKAGDALIGVASSGLHSNGFSLARRALLEVAGHSVDTKLDTLERSLGEELLEPTTIYSSAVRALRPFQPRALAHITGGGLPGNVPRVLPNGVRARIDRSAWQPPAIFELIRAAGNVANDEMFRTFNMGIGLVAVVPSDQADAAVRALEGSNSSAAIIGELAPTDAASSAEVELV